jgi:hypothetical protein
MCGGKCFCEQPNVTLTCIRISVGDINQVVMALSTFLLMNSMGRMTSLLGEVGHLHP